MQLKHIIILQNKIDLIGESVATNQHEAIQVCPPSSYKSRVTAPIEA